MIKAALIILILALTSSCGLAHGGGGGSASIISGPPGYTCFGIFDSAGELRGGSCVRD